MVRWQSRARLAIATFGIVFAAVVYFALGERQRLQPSSGVERLDPAAVLEQFAGELRQTETHGAAEVGRVGFDTHVTYADGSSRLTGVRIETTSNGRTYVVSSNEAFSARDSLVVELKGDVRVQASDGFELTTASGSYLRETGLVQTAEPVSFRKGRMAGSGRGMTYDPQTDVLRIFEAARVSIAGDGIVDTAVRAGAATLDRAQHLLTLDGGAQVREGTQTMAAARAVARLSPDDQHVTFVELRGGASVRGGEGIERLQARDIDLDYVDESRVLERVVLAGEAVAVTREGALTREFAGERLDVALGPDGVFTRVVGRTNVRVALPASADAPARTVESSTLDADAGEGAALERMRFEGNVIFRETAGTAVRVARAAALTVALGPEGSIGEAVFTGGTTFEDGELAARAAEAHYATARGVLRLSGLDTHGEPRVDDDSVTIDAGAITIGLENRRVEAAGNVKTTLLPGASSGRARGAGAAARAVPTRLPGLLSDGEAARVTAGQLLYDASAGTARYTGTARLWQKETEVRADSMSIDLRSGDLTARGAAETVLVFETGRSHGSADEIAYADALRRITYSTAPEPQAQKPARVTGPQGDVQAGRIEVLLADEGSTVQRLEAYGRVEAMVDDRRATGDRLTYHASDERYVVTGGAARPAYVRFAATCQEIVGGTLIFSRTADTMQVDGGEVIRTQTRREDGCR
jgi:LPS export ABC transporter protein LptC